MSIAAARDDASPEKKKPPTDRSIGGFGLRAWQ